MNIELLESISQNVLDLAMEFTNEHLEQNDGVIEGDGEFERDGYIFRFQVYPSAEIDKYEKKLKDKKQKKKVKMTPYIMASHWSGLYEKKFGFKYSEEPVPKDMRMFKLLMAEFNPDKLKDMLSWYLNNYKDLPSHSAMPSLEGFMHYRRDVAFRILNQDKEEIKETEKLGVSFE